MTTTVTETNRKLSKLINRLSEIRDFAIASENQFATAIEGIHPFYKSSARNLIHYLALRTFDLGTVQEQLSTLGLSSIGHSERYTLVNLNNILHLLQLLKGDERFDQKNGFKMDYPNSKKRLGVHATELFGPHPPRSRTRIMVTMPSEAATDKKLIGKLLDAGMNCARINCSHDTRGDWGKMIRNIKRISGKKGIPCLIYMDLAGPKLRTGSIQKNTKEPKKKKKAKKKDGILLHIGDTLEIHESAIKGRPAIISKKGNKNALITRMAKPSPRNAFISSTDMAGATPDLTLA